MARRSTKAQADLSAALVAAGIAFPNQEALDVVFVLAKAEFVEGVIPLLDGGVLLTVTSKGLASSSL
jgi:hypothetical protein